MNRKQTLQLLQLLKTAWPNSTLADNSDAVYFATLVQIDFADVQAAVKEAVVTQKFCPSPAELLALCRKQAEVFENYTPPRQPKAQRLEDIDRWFANGIIDVGGRQDLLERMERTYARDPEVVPAKV